MTSNIIFPEDTELEGALEKAQEEKWDALKRCKELIDQLAEAKERIEELKTLIGDWEIFCSDLQDWNMATQARIDAAIEWMIIHLYTKEREPLHKILTDTTEKGGDET